MDTSVWIDYFRGVVTPEADKLDNLLGVGQLVIGDLILTEVLQGFIRELDFDQGRKLLTSIPLISLVCEDVAVQAAARRIEQADGYAWYWTFAEVGK